ncbi:MFS transporter, partial [Sphingorhabdus sp.]|uniref:spinster family MFS transporter n=2 Tax=Sphingorhabdus sp. TaxID=1902408 RepID=UPI0034597960
RARTGRNLRGMTMANNEPTAPVSADDVSTLGQRWYVLFIMMLAYAINIADRYVMSTVLEPIRLELQLTDAGVAFLTGVSLAFFYVIMGIPLSWIADRYNRRNLLAASITIWSAMTALCGMSQGYMQLLLARIGVGVGEAGGTPSCNSIVADYFPAGRRAMAMTIFALGAPIGAWLGADMAGYVAAEYGWRMAFYVLGIPGILLAIVIMLTIKEPKRGRLDMVDDSAAPNLTETLKYIWSQKGMVHAIMGSGLSALWGWGLMWFTPTFIQRAYGLDVGEAGAVIGPIHLIMGIGASLLTAWLVGRPSYTDPRKVLRLLSVVTALATIPSIYAYYTNSLATATLMWWIFIPAIYFYIGPAMSLLQNLAPPKMRAMVIAVSLLVANVFNLIVAPQGVGLLSDYFAGPAGADAESLRMALLVLAPTGFWAAWHYWRAEKYAYDDQKRACGYV